MPKAYTPFVQQVVTALAELGPISARSMFGGWGVYHGDLMFGLIAYDVLYFKVDEQSKPYFQQVGSEPFRFLPPGRTEPMEMSYWEAPDGTMADPEALCEWGRLGLAAAKRGRAKSPKKSAKVKRPGKKAARKKRPVKKWMKVTKGVKRKSTQK